MIDSTDTDMGSFAAKGIPAAISATARSES